MKKNINIYSILGILFSILFLVFYSLLFIDKKDICPTGEVGLSSLNNIIDYKYNKFFDVVSDIFLFLAIGLALIFFIIYIIQIYKRRSLFKTDRHLSIFIVFCFISVLLWLLFDKVIVVNYRPIYVNGELEASFPSTHTFFTIFIFLSVHGITSILTKNKRYVYGTLIISIIISIIISFARIFSGMHYITDVIGGILLGLSLYFIEFGIIKTPVEDIENE